MSERLLPPDAYLADTSTTKGRGVFAARDFAEGEIVEIAPALVLAQGRRGLSLELRRRTFAWGRLLGVDDGSEAIVWGYGSLYNHDNPANMSYSPRAADGCMVFRAVRPIHKDTELTINYNTLGGGPVSDDDNWFERHEVEPI